MLLVHIKVNIYECSPHVSIQDLNQFLKYSVCGMGRCQERTPTCFQCRKLTIEQLISESVNQSL